MLYLANHDPESEIANQKAITNHKSKIKDPRPAVHNSPAVNSNGTVSPSRNETVVARSSNRSSTAGSISSPGSRLVTATT